MAIKKEVRCMGNIILSQGDWTLQSPIFPTSSLYPSPLSFCSQNRNTFPFNLFLHMKHNSYSHLNFSLFEKSSNDRLSSKIFSGICGIGFPVKRYVPSLKKASDEEENPQHPAILRKLTVSQGIREGVKAECSKTTRLFVSPSQMHFIRDVGEIFSSRISKPESEIKRIMPTYL